MMTLTTMIPFLTALLLLAIHIYPSLSYTVSGSTILDLTSNDVNFITEANQWSANSWVDSTIRCSFCNNVYLVGGYNVLGSSTTQRGNYFTMTYSIPSPLSTSHDTANLAMSFYSIDSWDGAGDGDYFQVQVIGTSTYTIDGWYFSFSVDHTVALCGSSGFNDHVPIQLSVVVPHSGSSLTLRIISQLSSASNDESFGFRDISINLYTSTTAVTPTLCGVSSVALPNKACPCVSTRMYEITPNTGICQACSSTCATCSGSLSSQCKSCDTGLYLTPSPTGSCVNCYSTCLTCTGTSATQCVTCINGYLLTPDNRCIPSCPYPLTQTPNGSQELCLSSCYPGNYVYWDQQCVSTCTYPLKTNTSIAPFSMCEYICNADQYLYWDQTCLDTCAFPLVNQTQHSRMFCTFPCNTAPNTILYWDGNCRSSCNFPLVSSSYKGKNLCTYPCKSSEYLYWNGTCINSCPNPLKVRIDTSTGAVYCDFPCSSTQIAYWDGSCSSSCLSPLTQISEGSPMVRYFCKYPCQLNEFLYWNGNCSEVCPPPLQYSYQNSRLFCLYPCLSTRYLLYDGTCIPNCNSPFTPRPEGGRLFCDNNCPSQYLLWDKTCSDTCNSPLLSRVQGSFKFCDFPCTTTTDFLYWNGTCSPTCPLPYTSRTTGGTPRNYCDYNCTSNEYLYYNGTCGQSCNLPYSIRVQNGLQYCDYPCTGIAPSVYLYWDGTCQSTCNSPRLSRTESTTWQFCEFACPSSSQFLYWNGTCSDYCMSPLTQRSEGPGNNTKKFCEFNCSNGEYLYWNGTCSTACSSPLSLQSLGTKSFCNPPCASVFEYYYPDTKECKRVCDTPYTIDQEDDYLKCMSPHIIVEEGWFVGNFLTVPMESKVSLVTTTPKADYVKFLDINMPPRLQGLTFSQSRTVFSLKFTFPIPSGMYEDFPNITSSFPKNGLHSNFIVNFWDDFISILTIFALGLIFAALEKISKIYGYEFCHVLFEKLRRIFKWNATIISITSSLSDIILFSAIQFNSMDFSSDSQGGIAGILICIIAILFYGGLLSSIGYLISQAFKIESLGPNHIHKKKLEEFRNNSQDYQIFFKGFKTESTLTRYFYLVYLIRLCLPMLITALLYQFPVAQMVIEVVINVIAIVGVLLLRPFHKVLNQVQILMFEAIALTVNICALIMALIDTNTNEPSVFLGDVIIFANFSANVLTLVFIAVKMLKEAGNIRKTLLGTPFHEKAAWIQLLAIPIQQAGMGFEEMIDLDNNTYSHLQLEDSMIEKKDSGNFLKNLFGFNKTTVKVDPKVQVNQQGLPSLDNLALAQRNKLSLQASIELDRPVIADFLPKKSIASPAKNATKNIYDFKSMGDKIIK